MKNGTVINQNGIKQLDAEDRKVCGTPNWSKYHMAVSVKGQRGNWIHCVWGIPSTHIPAVYKKIKDNEYLYQGDTRYQLTDTVKSLLDIH